MPSPKRRKKPVTSIQSLDADFGVAQTKGAKAKRKPNTKKMGEKRTGIEASLSIPTLKSKKQKRKGTKGGDTENAGLEGDDKERSSSAAIVKWANPELHYLTSNLINMISDSRVLRQAFNFDTSDSSGPINSGGKKTADHQHEIASSLLQNDPSSTGHGLIEDNREDEIWANSIISNIWDKIQKTFPWYKEMSTLLKSSPVVDKDASANSTTELDLSVLMTQPLGAPRGTTTPLDEEVSDTDHGSEDEELIEGVPGSPHLDEQPESHKNRSAPSRKVTATPSQLTKKNRPSPLDKASELVASQNATIGEVIKTNNGARKEHKKMEADIAIHIKKMELEHEMLMMEK
ncbi:hypothetical protein K439DRAFT_1610402 [Ramaria rubella]|nr:hypothetical protein K439DRAFT_1610402 [Ramaria rubella]